MVSAKCRLKCGRRQYIKRGVLVDRVGTVVSESRDRSGWRILWRGRQKLETVHKAFVEICEISPQK